MAQEAWRAYLELALGMSEASRKKATKAVKRLVGKGGATAEQLQVLAEDLVRTGGANREALARLVRVELDRTLARVGLASGDEVAELTARVRDLEKRLQDAEAAASATPVVVPVAAEPPVPAADPAKPAAAPTKKVAKKAVKATTAGPAPSAASEAIPVVGTEEAPAPVKKAVVKKAVAKKAPSTTAPAKKAPARKAATRKATAAVPQEAPESVQTSGDPESPGTGS